MSDEENTNEVLKISDFGSDDDQKSDQKSITPVNSEPIKFLKYSDTKTKLVGKTFDYKDLIKQVGGAEWTQELKLWTIPNQYIDKMAKIFTDNNVWFLLDVPNETKVSFNDVPNVINEVSKTGKRWSKEDDQLLKTLYENIPKDIRLFAYGSDADPRSEPEIQKLATKFGRTSSSIVSRLKKYKEEDSKISIDKPDSPSNNDPNECKTSNNVIVMTNNVQESSSNNFLQNEIRTIIRDEILPEIKEVIVNILRTELVELLNTVKENNISIKENLCNNELVQKLIMGRLAIEPTLIKDTSKEFAKTPVPTNTQEKAKDPIKFVKYNDTTSKIVGNTYGNNTLIKKVSGYKWYPDEKFWTIPTSNIDKLKGIFKENDIEFV